MQIGIDFGSSRIKMVAVSSDGRIAYRGNVHHRGDIPAALDSLVGDSGIADQQVRVGWTGNPASFSNIAVGTYTEKARALLAGVAHALPDAGSLLDAGAQQCLLISGLGPDSALTIKGTSGCSAGTGSFFEEQMGRLGLDLEDLGSLLSPEDRIPRIAGRCTVFARTDIIHRQQEGYSTSEILRGLAWSVARSLNGSLIRSAAPIRPLVLAGGMANNTVFVEALRETTGFGEDLFVFEDSDYLGALGAALGAADEAVEASGREWLSMLVPAGFTVKTPGSIRSSDPLPPLAEQGAGDSHDRHPITGIVTNPESLSLGIDVGSTSTNLVLLENGDTVVDFSYVPTLGIPVKKVKQELEALRNKYGFGDIPICVTGSGRRHCAEKLGFSMVRDEITTQARGARFVHPGAETIFEIGGQDSKFIRMDGDVVHDFRMNRICAAGTGAFLEEQAKQLNVSLERFVSLAMEGENPISLDGNCTVFMNHSVVEAREHGNGNGDIAAGLCYAVVKNYLKRVAAGHGWGNVILLQGGIAHNQAVVNAFRVITGRNIIVPLFFSVTGALGAALLAGEEDTGLVVSRAPIAEQEMRYEDLLTRGYTQPSGPGTGKRIGIPRVLFIYKLFPMFHAFFRKLGYDVLLSEPTGEETVARSQEAGGSEPCYPAKLMLGHVSALLDEGIDMLFLPSLVTMRHEGSAVRKDYACMMMQTAPRFTAKALKLEVRGVRLLAPELHMDMGPKGLSSALMETGKLLGKSRPVIAAAMAAGAASFMSFQKNLNQSGSDWLAARDKSAPAFALVTRTYGLHDEELNKGIPGLLHELEAPFITLSQIPVKSYGMDDNLNMYWPFGQHILKGVEAIAGQENLYLIYLTNHGCGPDTVLFHHVEEKMKGRPFLHIEVDEHASGEGIRTRLEAFIRSVRGLQGDAERPVGKASESDRIIYTYPPEDVGELFTPPFLPIVAERGTIAETGIGAGDADGSDLVRTKEDPALRALWGGLTGWLKSAPGNQTVCIPTNEGAGTDGQYAPLIRLWLDRIDRRDVLIYAPFLEDIPGLPTERFRTFAESLVRRDLVRWLTDYRDDDEVGHHGKSVAELATELRGLLEAINLPAEQKILITGDPWIIADVSWLESDIISPLTRGGYRPLRIPVSEMLCSYWWEKSMKTTSARDNMAYLSNLVSSIHQILGPVSPFSGALQDISALADDILSGVNGQQLRYQAARAVLESRNGNQVVHAAGLYDNGAVILQRLIRDKWTFFPYKGPFEASDLDTIGNLILRLERTQSAVEGGRNSNSKVHRHQEVII